MGEELEHVTEALPRREHVKHDRIRNRADGLWGNEIATKTKNNLETRKTSIWFTCNVKSGAWLNTNFKEVFAALDKAITRVGMLLVIAADVPADYMVAIWSGFVYYVFTKGDLAGSVIINLTPYTNRFKFFVCRRSARVKLDWFIRQSENEKEEILTAYIAGHTCTTKHFDDEGRLIKTGLSHSVGSREAAAEGD
jgi:hypothetical protein